MNVPGQQKVLTDEQLHTCLTKNLGHYRVMACQEAANEGPPDGISGALVLALTLRESRGKNVNNPDQTDKGAFQITERWHAPWLRDQPGCREGTWVAVEGHSAYEDGYCPRFTPALSYALQMLKDGRAFALANGVPKEKAVLFACSAFNAGQGGALKGWRESGDSDQETTGKDYGRWCMATRVQVHHWLEAHPKWQP